MDSVEAYISAVAKKDGTILKKGDPVLGLHTILEKFEQDLRETHGEMLATFRTALEAEYAKWNNESIARAERILAASLTAAKKDADTVFRTAADEELALLGAALSEKLGEVRAYQLEVKLVAVLNIVCVTIITSIAVIFFINTINVI